MSGNREAKRRYRDRKMAEKYGPAAIGTDMRGRHGNHARAQQNGRWNEGPVMLHSSGYVLVRVGKDHHLAMEGHGYAYLHEVVWVSAGRPLPGPGFLLHHRDEDKAHNSLDNLEVLSRSEHGELHAATRDRDLLGRFD